MKDDFLEFAEEEVARLETERRQSAKRILRSAIRGFRQATGLSRLHVSQLTTARLMTYQQWMLDRNKAINTIACYMRALRTAYNRMTNGTSHHVYGLFAGVYTGNTSRVKRAVDNLTMGRLLRADREKLPQELDKPLSWFMLMFLLRGIPFVDLAHLRKSDLHAGRIVYRRRKTGRELSVEVPREAMELIGRYAGECSDSPYLLPILTGEIKTEQQREARYQSALRRLNHRLERLTSLFCPAQHLSSYTPRHTWATIAYHNHTPVGVISKALGHSSIQVTEFYLKPFSNKEIDRTNKKVIAMAKRSVSEKDLNT